MLDAAARNSPNATASSKPLEVPPAAPGSMAWAASPMNTARLGHAPEVALAVFARQLLEGGVGIREQVLHLVHVVGEIPPSDALRAGVAALPEYDPEVLCLDFGPADGEVAAETEAHGGVESFLPQRESVGFFGEGGIGNLTLKCHVCAGNRISARENQ